MSLSLTAIQAAMAQETGEVFLMCLTITHPTLTTPLRVVNDGRDLVRSAGTFMATAFELTLPGQQDDRPPEVRLRIDAVDRSILSALRGLTSPPGIRLEVVLASSPNVIESGPYDLTLREVTYTATSIEGTLGYEDVLNEPFPKDTFTPRNFPGLF